MRVPQVGEELGRYRLDRVLGQGGMGIVFAATDQRLNRTVAIKVITGVLAQSPEFRARFQAEAAALALLDSPHVIAIHDHDEVDGTPYIVTQYVDGTDLTAEIAAHGAMPARRALEVCAQVTRGLGDAHRVGVIHRDVKPGNVLLRRGEGADIHAYLCDFGIARSEGVEGPAPTAAGMVAGTWSYLSPERTAGLPATPASDLYAVGVLLWTCLTGREPFQGTDVQVALAHQQAPIPRLPGAGPFIEELNAVIERALAKDPAERYTHASDLRADLERLAARAPDATVQGPASAPDATTVVRDAPPPPPPPPGPPAAQKSGRGRWAPVLVGVAALALVGGGIATWAIARGDDATGGEDRRSEPAVAGDIDGDGRGDVLLRQFRLGETISPLPLWRVSSTGKQFGSPVPGPGEDTFPIVGDTDGDGGPEVLWLDEDDGELRVHVVPTDNSSPDSTIDLVLDPVFDIKRHNIKTGDVDGDGSDDLVMLGEPDEGGNSIHVALAEDGGFAEPEQWFRSDLPDGQIWTGDFDGDGTDEILYWTEGDTSGGTATVLTAQDGELSATTSQDLVDPVVSPILASWSIGDVDGDGADEIGILSSTQARYFVYEVEGDAIAERTVWWQVAEAIGKDEALDNALSGDVRSVALSDVDGDGDADLVQVRDGEDDSIELMVHLSDGTSFAEGQSWGSLPCGDECTDGFVTVS
ncbi:hypothetical protein ASE01_05300 [Nocardioides sp. Root190]|uniref:protein kinase domain-containing protein n=1 Tax=Nocardioides sp. Root190 TaxID=1736488 RepID=UPI0006F7E084|nr:protein kinase [Nocardioides sp. Root190]KRB78662.1 hypothetical protein ASE01_05300 [Nocardioides sp. Root190]